MTPDKPGTGPRVRGFSLVELLVAIAIIAVLVAILLPSLAGARRVARMVRCQTQMAELGLGFFNYAGDGKGWLAAFSWQPNKSYSQWNELNNAGSATDAHCLQVTDILRRHGRTNQPRFTGRMVSRNYTHMVLVAGGYFASDSFPAPAVVCTEDAPALLWQRTPPEQIESLVQQGLAPADGTPQYRQILPNWSSYQLVPAVWAADTGNQIIWQPLADYRLYAWTASTRFHNRRMDDFAFPGQKVVYFDLFDRHFAKKQLFHGYPQAKQPLVFGDGSVQVKRTGDANLGWDPRSPAALNTTMRYRYRAIDAGDPFPLSGNNTVGDWVDGRYRWTRWGVRGVDFGAREPIRRP